MRVFKDTRVSSNIGFVEPLIVTQVRNVNTRLATLNIQTKKVEFDAEIEIFEKSHLTNNYEDKTLYKITSTTGDNIIVTPDTKFMLSDGSGKFANQLTNRDSLFACLYDVNTNDYNVRTVTVMQIEQMPRTFQKYVYEPDKSVLAENEVYLIKTKGHKNVVANTFVLTDI